MTVCLIGKSLTTLVLSKIFINNGVSVDIYYSNNKKIKSLYSKNSRNGLAVVSVERDACGGCFSKIPPQRQLDVKAHKKIMIES